jgi:hypothetical protein
LRSTSDAGSGTLDVGGSTLTPNVEEKKMANLLSSKLGLLVSNVSDVSPILMNGEASALFPSARLYNSSS